MEIIRADEAPIIHADPALLVQEYNFGNPVFNDAYIIIKDRYPAEGHTANRACSALVSVEGGTGSITAKGKPTVELAMGDRILIPPNEPYYFLPAGELAIRYISTPAWTADQTYTVE